MSQTQEVSVEDVRSTEEYQNLKDRVEELEEQVDFLADEFESIQRRQDEQQMMDNFGYSD